MKPKLSGITKFCCGIVFLLSAYSCSNTAKKDNFEQIITEWIGRKMTFPDSITAELQNHSIFLDLSNDNYKIVTILNTDNGCTSCQMMLPEWENLMSFVQSLSNNEEIIDLYYVIESSPTKEIRNIIDEFDFKYPIIYDPKKDFNKLNKFSDQFAYRTFLLDSNNMIKVLGNPITLPLLQDVYKKELSPDEHALPEEKVPCKLSQKRIPLGVISEGRRNVSSVIIKNITDSTIRIDKIISSCNCVSSLVKKKILLPGSESELKIFFYPDSLPKSVFEEEIFRNVYIYFNGVDNPVEIELYGYRFHDKN